jgi:hypothetical protein
MLASPAPPLHAVRSAAEAQHRFAQLRTQRQLRQQQPAPSPSSSPPPLPGDPLAPLAPALFAASRTELRRMLRRAGAGRTAAQDGAPRGWEAAAGASEWGPGGTELQRAAGQAASLAWALASLGPPAPPPPGWLDAVTALLLLPVEGGAGEGRVGGGAPLGLWSTVPAKSLGSLPWALLRLHDAQAGAGGAAGGEGGEGAAPPSPLLAGLLAQVFSAHGLRPALRGMGVQDVAALLRALPRLGAAPRRAALQGAAGVAAGGGRPGAAAAGRRAGASGGAGGGRSAAGALLPVPAEAVDALLWRALEFSEDLARGQQAEAREQRGRGQGWERGSREPSQRTPWPGQGRGGAGDGGRGAALAARPVLPGVAPPGAWAPQGCLEVLALATAASAPTPTAEGHGGPVPRAPYVAPQASADPVCDALPSNTPPPQPSPVPQPESPPSAI